jgi:hypothetical protein
VTRLVLVVEGALLFDSLPRAAIARVSVFIERAVDNDL